MPKAEQDEVTRKARKRELDRRAQRDARERTKDRITTLEKLVADLSQSDTNKQLEDILKQRDEIAAERDNLLKIVKSIGRLIGQDELPASLVGSRKVNDESASDGTSNSPEQLSNLVVDDGSLVGDANTGQQHSSESEDGMQHKQLDMQAITMVPTTTTNYQPDLEVLGSLIVPLSTELCECSIPPTTNTYTRKDTNLWRFANEVLTQPMPWSSQIDRMEEFLKDDIPVRAVLEGWDTAEQYHGGLLPPSWQKLRRIDEGIFATCSKVERLAVMITMQALLIHHQRGKAQSAEVPSWYLARPSQALAHSYAIDYFTWPGIRERFIFQQHRYCGNQFWKLLCENFRILWPFEFRDCYSRNTATGQYCVSSSFLDRIKDIKSWSMSVDMFKAYPEFISDIPVFDSMAISLSPVPVMSMQKGGMEQPPKQIGVLEDLDGEGDEGEVDFMHDLVTSGDSYVASFQDPFFGQSRVYPSTALYHFDASFGFTPAS